MANAAGYVMAMTRGHRVGSVTRLHAVVLPGTTEGAALGLHAHGRWRQRDHQAGADHEQAAGHMPPGRTSSTPAKKVES